MSRLGVVLVLILGSVQLRANAGAEYFEAKVRPLFHAHCLQCHGEKLQSADIDLRKPATVIGTAVVSGDESSPLIRAIRYEASIKMPPSSKLPREAIDTLVDWVRMGAPWPGYEPVDPSEVDFDEESVESDHWAFRPVNDPPVPAVADEPWPRNDIDHFVLAKLRANGLVPAPGADRLTLLRRAKFDLLGLPPTEKEIEGFLADGAPGAFRRLVDRLLRSPHYGERWGRHWLDVARYADSTGVDEDHPFGDSWRYRDYVVSAFNDDLPFDRFVREQVAGDLLPAPEGQAVNTRGIIATGFLALGPMALAQRDPIQKKYDVVDEQIDTLSKAFLGLTVACARCHDHKFDPILTSDYYALAGIFASTRTFDDWRKNGSRYYKHPLVELSVYEDHRKEAAAVERLQFLRRVARQIAVSRYVLARLVPQLPDYLLAAADAAEPDGLDGAAVSWFREYLQPRPSRRPHLAQWHAAEASNRDAVAAAYRDELLATLEERLAATETWFAAAVRAAEGAGEREQPEFLRDLPTSLLYKDLTDEGAPFDLDPEEIEGGFAASDRARLAELHERIERGRQHLPPEPPMANSVAEDNPVQQRVFRRGQHKNPGAIVGKRFPLVLAGTDQPPIESGSGRLELANWLASDANPLTARVMVNRIWLWHFGQGLVRTPNNYGLRGEAPTHPQLLDWLARRFIEGGWSVKDLHRLIMDSATYRMGSAISEDAYAKDPENRLWSRFQRRRLTFEEVRDSYLQISGRLDVAIGGDTDIGSGELAEFDRNNRRLDPDDYVRRSIYLPLMRNKLPALLGLFDFGDATTANGQRSVTNVAPQALYLMNSDFVQRTAADTARQLAGSDAKRIERAYRLVLSRPPTASETERTVSYVRAYDASETAWASLCKTLLASNEFHHVD